MSQPGQLGPFPPPTPKPAAAPAGVPAGPAQMEYLRSFQYIFENPNWLMNLVWAFLCNLAGTVIPIVPGMVFMGYQFESIEDLYANRGTKYPDFDINRLVDYLGRGVWPVLVMLAYAFVFTFFAIFMVFGTIICSGALSAAGGKDLAPVLATVGILLGVLVSLALGVAASIYCTPMMLRAGLAQDIGAAFEFGWVNDFVAKMWVEIVLSALFMFFAIGAVSLITCGAAAIVLGPMTPFVSMHLNYQLYSIYLARGGTPIPFKPRMAPQAAR